MGFLRQISRILRNGWKSKKDLRLKLIILRKLKGEESSQKIVYINLEE